MLKNNIKSNVALLTQALFFLIPIQFLISVIQYVTGEYAGFRILGESYSPFRATSLIDSSQKGISGTLIHPGILGLFLLMLIPFLIQSLLVTKKHFALRVATCILAISMILLTSARTSIFLMFFSIVIVLLLYLIIEKKLHFGNLSLIIFSSIPISVLLVIIANFFGLIERFLHSDFVYQIFYRWELNKLAFDVWGSSVKNVIFGTGLNTYTDIVSQMGTGFAYENPVHNFFILTLVEGGIIHFSLLMILIIIVVKSFIKSFSLLEKKDKLLGVSLLLTIFVAGAYSFFGWAIYHNQNTILFSIIVILLYQLSLRREHHA